MLFRKLLRPHRPYPIWLTLLSFAASALLTFFVFLPELHILSVATFRAVFVWYTWYGSVFEAAQNFLRHAPWLPVPYVLVATAMVLRRMGSLALPSPGSRVAGRRQPLWSRLVLGLIAVLLLPSALGLFTLLWIPAASHGWGYYFTTGGGLQRSRCSKCHSPYRPFHFIKSADLWRTTVRRMRQLEGAPINEKQEAVIVSYLAAKAAYTDEWVFRAKCLGCHRRRSIDNRPRTAEEWNMIIDRVSRVSPYAYRLDWKRQLKRHASRSLADKTPLSQRIRDKITFERVCGGCHALQRALRAGKNTTTTVDRMLRKVPSRTRVEDRAPILRHLKPSQQNWDALKAVFPHDGPLEVSW